MCFAAQRRALFRRLDVQKWSVHVVLCTFWLGHVLCATTDTTACIFSTSQLPKVLRSRGVFWCVVHFDFEIFATACTFSTAQPEKVVRTRPFLTLFTWKCASRHNGVHFFQPLNFQECAEGGVFVLSWKCASRHNSVQFFISHLTTWLRTRRFSEVTFRPYGATHHWKKHSGWRLSYLFTHLHLLSSLSSSSLIFSLLFFSSLTLPTSSFPSVHIVGSLTSKLPSNNLSSCKL